MVDRIRALLAARQLTPTQFADFIGVGRPIVSHILSGRNKPSLEVIQKVINAFPDLALPWLLAGNGPMWADPEADKPAQSEKPTKKAVPRPQPAPSVGAIVAPTPPVSVVTSPESNPDGAAVASSLVVPSAPEVLPIPETAPARPPMPAPPVAAAAAPLTEPVVQAVKSLETASLQALAAPDKPIKRIVIFYHDGTFSSFQPE